MVDLGAARFAINNNTVLETLGKKIVSSREALKSCSSHLTGRFQRVLGVVYVI